MSSSGNSKRKVVYVVYYSMYGHILTLSKQVVLGLEKSGVKVKLFQVPETLTQEVLTKMHAPPKAADVPVISPSQLADCDGVLFGIPTRFGMLPAQMKAFFDACGQLWMTGALKNKFVGTFFSTASLGAGQETTAFSTLPFFAHQGMIYVSFGAKHRGLSDDTHPHGGSPWGAGTLTGADGSRPPSELELELALFQGFDFGTVVKRTNF